MAPEGPVDLERDTLFRYQEDFYGRLNFLAEHVAAAVFSAEPSQSAVYGVSAPWGSGKSSALHVLLDLVYARLKEAEKSIKRDANGFLIDGTYVVTTSTFFAPSHAASSQPARLGLAYEILQGLPSYYREQLLDDLNYTDDDLGAVRPIKAELYLREKLDSFSAGPFVERWILESFLEYRASQRGSSKRLSHVHIQLIDDLDRCPTAYTAEILAALNFWVTSPNLFFAIAADEEHLRKSAQAATDLEERYHGEALEKFVHFQIRLPELLSGFAETARYCEKLVPEDPVPRGIAHLRNLLQSAPTDGPLGVLAPALFAHTPRQAKRVFNELLQEFSILSDVEGDSVKRIISRLVWPEAFTQFVAPAITAVELRGSTSRRSARLHWLRQLIQVAEEVLEDGTEDLAGAEARLNSLAKERGIYIQECPPALLLYLAAPPTIRLPEEQSDATRAQQFLRNVGDRESAGAESNGDTEESISQIATRLSISHKLGRRDEALDDARKIVAIARRRQLRAADAPTIGNVAIRLDTWAPELAWQLHELAHAADPTHENIELNLAEFLLEYGSVGALPTVAEHLASVAQRAPEFKPNRQALLSVRLTLAQGYAPAEGELDLLVQAAIAEDSSDGFRTQVFQLLEKAKDYVLLEKLMQQWAEAERSKPEKGQASMVLRYLAYSFSVSSDDEIEARGIDLIRHLLWTGNSPDDEAFTSAANNLAVLLSGRGYEDIAGMLWRIAYDIDSESPQLKASYSSHLISIDDAQNAQAVQLGQMVDIRPLSDAEMEAICSRLPAYFSTGPWWWEEGYMPVSPYRPIDALQPRGGESRGEDGGE
ncbi:P-loop NTPase fold protein [Streptomyces sp. NPDC021056]|uniref:P-loop NTPase fold protein n=1 Tax=Streptomyces sp. NPDC021056 TaxID=3155012 RepID=UPI0033D8DC90